MRILYFSQYFPPEVGATQTRAYEMSRYLASRGHLVTVVTEVPNHPSGIIPPAYRGKLSERRREDGVDALRLWVSTSPEKTFRTRMQFYLSYMGMAALAGTLLRGHYDVVFATSPPLFVGVAGLVTATARRIPLVFEVRDLWPESAVALGELSNRRAVRAAEVVEKLLYARAARMVVVTQGIESRLLERGIPRAKVRLITNGANIEHFHFDAAGRARVRELLGVGDRFVVMYAGIHGIAQGLETLLGAARRLLDRSDIEFVLVGEGPRKRAVRALAEEMGFTNLRFVGEVPSAEMPAYLSAADCTIVPLRDEPVFRGALPSKMFEAWACERPVVVSVAGEAERVVREAGGGLVVRPEDAAAMAAAIAQLAGERDEAAAMGGRGRAYVVAHYDRKEQAARLEKLLDEVVRRAK